jgi:protein tyrosine phosphatase (PTP) superfamily phosphohydrolase (DUF442 family)
MLQDALCPEEITRMIRKERPRGVGFWLAGILLAIGGIALTQWKYLHAIPSLLPEPPIESPVEDALKEQPSAAAKAPQRLNARHLPQPIEVADQVISGGLPEGPEAFAELQALGVRTILSVDGATPQVELAKKYGMRYVHLPHGYDGIAPELAARLAQAVRDLPGPIYIHCHHGKHRSPAAAAVACIGAGKISNQAGREVLKLAGTNPKYVGLYQAVESATALPAADRAGSAEEYPQIAELPWMARAMVAIDSQIEALRPWIEPTSGDEGREGIDASQLRQELDQISRAALLLREEYKEMRRRPWEVDGDAERFQQLMLHSEQAAEEIEMLLDQPGPWTPSRRQSLQAPWGRLMQGCKDCHEGYRDRAAGKLPRTK